MATPGTTAGETSTGTTTVLGRLVVVTVFTGIETVALAAWLALVVDAPALSEAAAGGLALLVAGLVVEHVLTGLAVTDRLSFPDVGVLFVSVTEALLWAVWLGVAERVGGLEGVAVAGGVLAVLLVPQHTVEDNALRGNGLLSELLDLHTLGFSLIEAVGASVWLALVLHGDRVTSFVNVPVQLDLALETIGLAVLAVALLVEHVVGVRFSRR